MMVLMTSGSLSAVEMKKTNKFRKNLPALKLIINRRNLIRKMKIRKKVKSRSRVTLR